MAEEAPRKPVPRPPKPALARAPMKPVRVLRPGERPGPLTAPRARWAPVTPQTVQRGLAAQARAKRKANDINVHISYGGTYERYAAFLPALSTGIIVVSSDGQSDQLAVDLMNGLSHELFARHGHKGVITDNSIFESSVPPESCRYLIVDCASDARLMARVLPYADRMLLIIHGIWRKYAVETLSAIRDHIYLDCELPDDVAAFTWAAFERNLRFVVRCQQRRDTAHATVFALARDEDDQRHAS